MGNKFADRSVLANPCIQRSNTLDSDSRDYMLDCVPHDLAVHWLLVPVQPDSLTFLIPLVQTEKGSLQSICMVTTEYRSTFCIKNPK